MRIPATLPLLGQTVTVAIIPISDWQHGEDCLGVWNPQTYAIALRADIKGAQREQVFTHELTHAILDCMSHKLSRNEVFVDQFAGLLHQALAGAKYKR